MSAARVKSVLIVEDHQALAELLEMSIERQPDLKVIGRVRTVADAAASLRAHPPDVVLLDFFLPDGTGKELLDIVHEQAQGTAVVVLTGDTREETLLEAITAGAAAYVAKAEPLARVLDALRRAVAHESLIPASLVRKALQRQDTGSAKRARRDLLLNRLTRREREVLLLIGAGMSNKAMAEDLRVSVTTVRAHVQSVLQKLSVHSKLEAMAKAQELDISS